MSTHLAGGKELVYTLVVPLALAVLHRSLLNYQSVLCPGPWFYCPCSGSAPAQAQVTAPSALLQAGTEIVRSNFLPVPAELRCISSLLLRPQGQPPTQRF